MLAVVHSWLTCNLRSPRRGEPGAARPARVGRAAHLGLLAPFAPAPARGMPRDQSPGSEARLPPARPRRPTTGPAVSEARRPPPGPRRPPPPRPAGPRARFPPATQRKEGAGLRPHPFALSPPSLFPREWPLAACPRDWANRWRAVGLHWTTSLPLGRRPARDWPRRRPGFESQPPSGSVLPKCHVGPRGCVRSRLGAPAVGPHDPSQEAGRRRQRAALDRRRGGVSRPRAALAEGGGAGGEPGAAAAARWGRGPLPLGEPAEMLAENLVEEFEMKEDEPWYDQRDLQQGEGAGCGRAAWPRERLPAANLLQSCFCSLPTAPGARQGRRPPAVPETRRLCPCRRGRGPCAVGGGITRADS